MCSIVNCQLDCCSFSFRLGIQVPNCLVPLTLPMTEPNARCPTNWNSSTFCSAMLMTNHPPPRFGSRTSSNGSASLPATATYCAVRNKT